MELTRKDMLKMSALGTAALAIPVMRPARTALTLKDRIPASRLPNPFSTRFTVPKRAKPVRRDATTDFYHMTMKQGYPEILPGMRTEVWGYDGLTPGPTIVARRGRNVVVRHVNDIKSSNHTHTSVHLHGNASKPQYDGYASDTTARGEGKDYHYPNRQDARTLWYHDHGVHDTARNAYMGCAAFYITHDNRELSLRIPHGRYDIPVVLRDAVFSRNGQLIFDDQGHSTLMGDVILVNGAPWPVMKVERRKYRFRFLNAAIARSFELSLSTGEPMTIIGTDGGLMPHPVRVRNFRIGMAERYEVVIDFSKYRVGQRVILRNGELRNNQDFANTHVVMAFDVASDAKDLRNNSIPQVLNPDSHVMKLRATDAANRNNPVRLELERQGGEWTINGSTWHDVEDSKFKNVLARVRPGEVQVWELVNKSSGWFHPLHIHLIDFKMLSREGGKVSGIHPYERGPKDTAYLGEGETIRVVAKFAPHEGKYMVHCHNLVHEDHDMMGQFEVGSGGDPWDSDGSRPVRDLKPFGKVRFKG